MRKRILMLAVASVLSQSAWAVCSREPHLNHTITVKQDATCELAKLYESQLFCLLDSDGNELNGPFVVTAGKTFNFGMSYREGADFNMKYALTCVLIDKKTSRSPTVGFTVGSIKPGVASINKHEYDGAVGQAKVKGRVMSFDMDFQPTLSWTDGLGWTNLDGIL